MSWAEYWIQHNLFFFSFSQIWFLVTMSTKLEWNLDWVGPIIAFQILFGHKNNLKLINKKCCPVPLNSPKHMKLKLLQLKPEVRRGALDAGYCAWTLKHCASQGSWPFLDGLGKEQGRAPNLGVGALEVPDIQLLIVSGHLCVWILDKPSARELQLQFFHACSS